MRPYFPDKYLHNFSTLLYPDLGVRLGRLSEKFSPQLTMNCGQGTLDHASV